MNSYKLRSLATLATNVLFITILSYVNHTLSAFSTYIYLDGLIVIFAVTCFGFKAGFWILLLTGIFRDSYNIIPIGLSSSLYLISFTIIHLQSFKIRYDLTSQNLIVALITNAFMFLCMSTYHSFTIGLKFYYILGVFTNLILSELLLILLIKWFYGFQKSVHTMLGIPVEYRK